MDTLQRWRLTFAKGTPIKYVAHLDLCQAWERAFRRAGLPFAYTQGFNPQARLQLAAALPVGYTGSAELMDVLLTQPVEAQDLVDRLRSVLPRGFDVRHARPIDLQAAALQSTLRQAEYRVLLHPPVPAAEVDRRITQFLGLEHFEQRRIRKQQAETIDLRPLVDDLRRESGDTDALTLWMRVTAGAVGNVRPETVLDALELGGAQPQVERIRLICEGDE